MRILRNVPMASRTSLRVGGRARLFASPRSVEELTRLVGEVRRRGWRVHVLGEGTNTVFPDGDWPGFVISTEHLEGLELDRERHRMLAEAGVGLGHLVRESIQAGLAGLETYTAIPGSIGGAVFGNAGSATSAIGELVRRVEVIRRDGSREWLPGEAVSWRYRSSGLGDHVISRVELQLREGVVEDLRRCSREARARKRRSQPLAARSAGCVFRNPPGESAGHLIEAAGLKGARIGGAVVSTVHANFIINESGATAADFEALAARVRDVVRRRFGTRLRREVVRVGGAEEGTP